ncbi:ribbon-helix-helix domain-containing protein [Amycolatopsis dongchuanensis]|uniref:Ribbon-helix-helix domain-containing protein n=1 Tax=Amycolatopsis dongchuanensis TaxID=1070866 RepID=A0ABP9Q8R4_9PSEU
MTLDDALLREAKTVAVRSGRSFSAVLEDALRVWLAERADARRQAAGFRLPVDGEGGLRPGVDLGDKEALSALLDEDVPFADR